MSKKYKPRSKTTPAAKKQRNRPMSKKRQAIIKARITHPHATLKEVGEMAGYTGNTAKTMTSLVVNDPKIKDKIRGLMDAREKLTLGALFVKLEEGLDAKVTRRAQEKGKFGDEKEDIDYVTRHKYLDTAAKWRGDLVEKDDKADGVTNPLDIQVILGKKGTVEDRENAGNILLAIRIRRGLHPTENRPMTTEEVDEWQAAHPSPE